ncbi:MAG: hypothetical protein Fur002_08680 [Anaerolineales bacterium]
MQQDLFTHLMPYIALMAIPSNLLTYTWGRKKARGALAFILYLFGQVVWMLALILETAFFELEYKIFWESVQWVAGALALSIPMFALEYTEYALPRARAWGKAALLLAGSFILCIALDPVYHWIYANPRLEYGGWLPRLAFDYTPLGIAYVIYGGLAALTGMAILFRSLIHPGELFRAQVSVVLFGFFAAALGGVLTALKFHAFEYEIAPFAFALGDLVIAWGLFRFGVFKVTAMARERIFEAMVEPVVVLDNDNIVVDVNTSMLDLLDMQSAQVIGKPAKEVFENFPIPIKKYLQTIYTRAESQFQIDGKTVHYEMTAWPLQDAQKNISGRIFISHDITALKELEQELRTLNAELEERVLTRTRELAETYDATLEGWARALELRDKETEGHTRRVTSVTVKVAKRMGITGDDLEQTRRGALLHDIGKMGIPDSILLKPGKLTKAERALMETHATLAYQMLEPIAFLKKALDIPYCHHEKWDGSGYPRGLAGQDIPLAARIFAIADVWDAITSERPYKKAWKREKAVQHLMEQSGKHFDPQVVSVFLEMVLNKEI